MLTVLGILKVLGIILLCILGAVILLLLLVLFAPVRYRIRGSFRDNTPCGCAGARWLLGALGIRASFDSEDGIKAFITVFGIKAYDLTDRRSEGADEVHSDSTDEAHPDSDTKGYPNNKKEDRLDKDTEAHPEKDTVSEKSLDAEKSFHDLSGSIRDRFEAVLSEMRIRLKGIADTAAGIYEAVKEKTDKAGRLYALYHDSRYQADISMAKRQAVTLLKEIRPRKGHGRLMLGTGDPYSTAQAMQAAALLYPVYGDVIEVIPDFEGQIFEADADIRGRVHAVVLLYCAGRIFFCRKLRRLYHEAKRIINDP